MAVRRTSRSKTRAHDSAATFKRVGAVSLAVLVLAAIGGALYVAQTKTAAIEKIDQTTFCPKSGPSEETAILIDRTDSLTALQAESLSRRLETWAHEVRPHGAFRVYEVGKGGTLLAPVLAICNPGDGLGESGLTSNPGMLKKRYDEKFEKPLKALIVGMQQDEKAKISPIMEGVQAIAVRDFGPDAKSLTKKRLIIVTDLLQFTSGLSLYKKPPDFAAFSKSPYAGSIRADLADVSVDIQLLHRMDASDKQTDDLANFWIRWLEDQGATVDAFIKVPG